MAATARQRSTSYSHEEDKHLCHVYLDISQNPIIGINQSRDQFWSHIEAEYNSSKPVTITQDRAKKSLQCRMQIILSAIGKLRGCVRQIENQNPSGASQIDILNRAKVLLEQDKKYDKGFKFDHVWEILKDSQKFGDDHSNATPYRQTQTSNFVSSQANSPATESPTSASPGLSSFSPDINDLSVDGCSSQRPIGVKKAKEKRKVEEHTSAIIDTIKEEQRQVIEILKKNSADRQQNYEIQMLRAQNEKRKLDMAPYLAENKILIKDLNSIDDPILREHFRNEQLKILQKRSTHDQAAPHGFHDDIPEY